MTLRESQTLELKDKLVAMVFYYAGLIEKWGTGTTNIADACRAQGLPEPEFKEEAGGFCVTFWKDIYNETYLSRLGLNDRQVRAVLYAKEKGSITNREYREITGLSDEGARLDIRQMVEKGVLVPKGKGRSTCYVLRRTGH